MFATTEEAEALQLIRELRADGMTIRAIAEELNARGVPCRGERWHLKTEADRVTRMREFIAGVDATIVGRRTSEAMQSMRARNLYTGGKSRYGFDVVDGQLVENAAEQLVIQDVKVMREGGLSLRAIAKQLESKGMFARAGKPWTAQSIANIAASIKKEDAE